ncbi:MAG: helix-turn-helix domain-containing protein [Beijerinckiaceae bacterium]
MLAARIGCRREQITRELGAMERDGLLEKTRGALVLPDPEAMCASIRRMMSEAG